MYYKRYHVQTRLTFYWSAGVYAGGFSGVSRILLALARFERKSKVLIYTFWITASGLWYWPHGRCWRVPRLALDFPP